MLSAADREARRANAPASAALLAAAVVSEDFYYACLARHLDALFVQTAFVDKAPNKFLRRWRPRAMGRATRIQKGLSHITVILGERA